MKRFYNNILGNKEVADAITIAEKLFMPDSPMMIELKAKNDWKYNSGTGEEVFKKITECTKIAPVFMYKSKWFWSAALGYSDGKSIYINSRKFGSLDKAELIGLLLHEAAHMCGFSHANNYKTEDKVKFSVPYYVSENIVKWL